MYGAETTCSQVVASCNANNAVIVIVHVALGLVGNKSKGIQSPPPVPYNPTGIRHDMGAFHS